MSSPDLCRATSSLQEVLVETVQVLDRVEHGEPRPHAEEQRDLAEARLQVEDHRRPLASGGRARRRSSPRRSSCPRRLSRRGTRESRRAGCAPAVAASRRAAVRRTAPWNDSSIARDACVAPPGVHGKNSFAPARIAWRIRSGSAPPRSRRSPAPDAPRAAARSPPCPDEASARMSTSAMSGGDVSAPAPPRGCRSGRRTPAAAAPPDRLNSSSCVMIDNGQLRPSAVTRSNGHRRAVVHAHPQVAYLAGCGDAAVPSDGCARSCESTRQPRRRAVAALRDGTASRSDGFVETGWPGRGLRTARRAAPSRSRAFEDPRPMRRDAPIVRDLFTR